MSNNMNKDIELKYAKFKKEEAEKELIKLRKEEEYHSKKYYEENTNEISDYEYDYIKKSIIFLEEKFALQDEMGVRNRIGAGDEFLKSSTFEKIEHIVKMQSLEDVFSYEEVESFVNRVEKEEKVLIEKELNNEPKYVVETKIDGLSASIEYLDGKIVRALTRGNGSIGEDVTANIYTIANLPKTIEYKGHLIVRGEVLVDFKTFEEVNEQAKKEESKTFLNPRNLASGSLRLKDTEKVRSRKLSIYIFNVQISDKKFKTHTESLNFLKEQGFVINPYVLYANNYSEILSQIKKIGEIRDNLSFGIDGAVVKVNNLEAREHLGVTEKYPKWAVAYKYPARKVETEVLDIDLSIGRTGVLTPTAILKPVLVDGSVISRVTLNNLQYIKSKDVRIGDIVLIHKAGDVIPEIYKVILDKRKGNLKEFEYPKICPACKQKLEYENIVVRCVNPECPEIIEKNIIYFASKKCMNIEGLGEQIVRSLISLHIIKDLADIYKLKIEDLEKIRISKMEEKGKVATKKEKEKLKFENNLINAINKSKENDLYMLITALGIREIGEKVSKLLADKFITLENLSNAKIEELEEIPGVGEVASKYIYEYFRNKNNQKILNKLKELGVNTEKKQNKNINILETKLKGKKFVITGKFEKSKKEIIKYIEENGGVVDSSVTQNTDYLVYAQKGSTKYNKAEKLNIPVITLIELYNLKIGE